MIGFRVAGRVYLYYCCYHLSICLTGRRAAAGIPVVCGACISAQWRGHGEAVTVTAGEVGGGTAVPFLLRGFADTTREQASNVQYSLSALCERIYLYTCVSVRHSFFHWEKYPFSPQERQQRLRRGAEF